VPLNPVRAGLCRSPEGWPWSSYAATVGLRHSPWFLDAEPFLSVLGSRGAYVDWVRQGVDASMLDESGAPKPPSLASLLADGSDRSIVLASQQHGHTKDAIAEHLGLSRWQVNRRLARAAQLGPGPNCAG
jgi:hypothetical protein